MQRSSTTSVCGFNRGGGEGQWWEGVCGFTSKGSQSPESFRTHYGGTIISHGTPDDWLIMGRQHFLPRQDKNAIKRSFILLLGVHYFSIPTPQTKTVTSGPRACQRRIQISLRHTINSSTFYFYFLCIYLFIFGRALFCHDDAPSR